MSAATATRDEERHVLTRRWGDQWATLLWDEFLARADVSWEASTVLDFGCGWGYLPKLLVERAGVKAAHGVDRYPVWEAMTDGFRPQSIPGVQLYSGDVREIRALQRLRFDTIVSIGTLNLLEPTVLMETLHWFYDHLKPGGRCLLHTRTFAHYDGANLGGRAPRFGHLLFSRRDLEAHLERMGAGPAPYVNPSCAATYLTQFARAGFQVARIERLHDGSEDELLREHAAKLRWLDPEELRTSALIAHLQRPSMPDLRVLDRDA